MTEEEREYVIAGLRWFHQNVFSLIGKEKVKKIIVICLREKYKEEYGKN